MQTEPVVMITYEVETKEDGDLESVSRLPEGETITIDENDQHFCDFLTWAAHQPGPVATGHYNIKKPGFYLACEDRLVEHCKETAFSIYSEPIGSHGQHLFA
jgi:hypothetical protein